MRLLAIFIDFSDFYILSSLVRQLQRSCSAACDHSKRYTGGKGGVVRGREGERGSRSLTLTLIHPHPPSSSPPFSSVISTHSSVVDLQSIHDDVIALHHPSPPNPLPLQPPHSYLHPPPLSHCRAAVVVSCRSLPAAGRVRPVRPCSSVPFSSVGCSLCE